MLPVRTPVLRVIWEVMVLVKQASFNPFLDELVELVGLHLSSQLFSLNSAPFRPGQIGALRSPFYLTLDPVPVLVEVEPQPQQIGLFLPQHGLQSRRKRPPPPLGLSVELVPLSLVCFTSAEHQ